MRLGDLDELKEKVALMWGDNNHITESIYEIIDNAPTVEEVSIIEFKEPLPPVKAQKILRALNKRPQGRWIENLDSHNDEMQASCYCSECDASCYCATDKFCHACGAYMRGKEE